MKIRFLPQITRTIEVHLNEEAIFSALEKKFEIPYSNKWYDKLLYREHSSFERGDKMFRIDKTVIAGRNEHLDIIALGYLDENKEGWNTITLVYAAYNDWVELLTWIWCGILAFTWFFIVIVSIFYETEGSVLLCLVIIAALGCSPLLFRLYLKGELNAVHSKIVWSLKKA